MEDGTENWFIQIKKTSPYKSNNYIIWRDKNFNYRNIELLTQ